MVDEEEQRFSGSRIVQCHYEILGVGRDADSATIKKNHRKQALKHHPDKNLGDDAAANKFLLIQQAYEVLSDPQERKWYDDHRDAILAGWSTSSSSENDTGDIMLFNVAAYMHPGCYSSYHNENGGFYQVFTSVFENIVSCELKQSERIIDLPSNFGTSDTNWEVVRLFYQSWESFSSALNFAWEDKYNSREDGENRRIRRLMDEENKKGRKTAKKIYNSDILQLVSFIKRRDPRVKAKLAEQVRLKKEQEAKQKEEKIERKKERQKAKETWREASILEMEKAEEEDRMKGRIRLADLEDDYDYGGRKKRRGKNKGKKATIEEDEDEEETYQDNTSINQEENKFKCIPVSEGVASENEGKDTDQTLVGQDYQQTIMKDPLVEVNIINDDYEDKDSSESEEEPDMWRCECCRKDFKSEAQMQNHTKSKKHKVAFKKYEAKLKKREEEIMEEMLEEMAVNE
mmetsp:Transcript_36406/g.36792  ORF Transcript_36406/g.36792 Transcript_36406/m.36792 type:complete len:459 (+) Transcript_36406:136-1512(+)